MSFRFLSSWKQDIHLLNDFENTYLAELRDALLPDLMSGKLDVTNIDLQSTAGGN